MALLSGLIQLAISQRRVCQIKMRIASGRWRPRSLGRRQPSMRRRGLGCWVQIPDGNACL